MAITGAGSQTAAVGFGGGYPVSNMNLTEEYDGTSWTTTSNLATSRTQLGSAGTAAAALCIGGKSTYSCNRRIYRCVNAVTSLDVS